MEKHTRFREILQGCDYKAIEYINVGSLLPYLQREGLINTAECQVLTNNYKTDTEKNRFLLSILPTKGDDAFERFVRCLNEDKSHLGHVDLATLLKSFENSTLV